MESWEEYDLISCLDKFADKAEDDIQHMYYAISDMSDAGIIDKDVIYKATRLRSEILSKIYELHSLGKK